MSRNYLEAIIVFIVAVGFLFFLTLPKYKDLQVVFQKIGEKEAEIKNRQEYFADLGKTSDSLNDYQASLIKIESALPVGENAPDLMNFIQAVAVESGLISKHMEYAKSGVVNNLVGNVPAGDVTEGAKRVLHKYEVKAIFSGGYDDLKAFIVKIGSSSRMIEINSIVLKNAENKENSGTTDTNTKEAGNNPADMDFQVDFSVNYY